MAAPRGHGGGGEAVWTTEGAPEGTRRWGAERSPEGSARGGSSAEGAPEGHAVATLRGVPGKKDTLGDVSAPGPRRWRVWPGPAPAVTWG